MATFNLVHISDLHFAVEQARSNPFEDRRYVELLLDFNNRYLPSTFCARKAVVLADTLGVGKDNIDVLLITGDIATSGSMEDLSSAKEWITGNASAEHVPRIVGFDLPNEFIRLGDVTPLVILPGNHDRFSGKKNSPGSPNFETVFGVNWDLGRGSTTLTSFHGIREFNLKKDGEHLSILSADLTLKAESDADRRWGYLGQGYAYDDVCQGLVQATAKCVETNPNVYVIWATHFPPDFEHKKVGSCLKLLNSGKLVKAATDAGVNLIFCGHTHIRDVYKVAGVNVICAGTAIAFGKQEAHSFNAITLETQGGKLTKAAVIDFLWDENDAAFNRNNKIHLS